MTVTVVATILYNLALTDLQDVKDKLCPFNKGNWMELGRELGVKEEDLETVRADYTQKGVNECLTEMLKHWLRRNYDEAKHGSPTWDNLANAVKKSGDAALAHDIRGNTHKSRTLI